MNHWLKAILGGVLHLVRAVANGKPADTASGPLMDTILNVQQLSDLVGRSRTLREAAAASRGKPLPDVKRPFLPIPSVPFDQAIEDLLARQPRLAQTRDEITETYSQEHGFAMIKSSELEVTEWVQARIAESMKKGIPREAIVAEITEATGWPRAYAQTVYRTNVATAQNAGRFAAMKDPEVARALPAFEYHTMQDRDVRDGHRPLEGLVAAWDWPGWEKYRPPNGFNCRCSVRSVSRAELARRGLLTKDGRVRTPRVPGGVVIDPGFEKTLIT